MDAVEEVDLDMTTDKVDPSVGDRDADKEQLRFEVVSIVVYSSVTFF